MTVNVDSLIIYAVSLAHIDDENIMPQATRQDIVPAAVERYGHDRPEDVTTDVTGDGGRYYGITASLASWVEGYSTITSIEYPAITIASDDVPVYLDNDDWDDDYWVADTRYLFLPNHAPASTETMRIRHTVPYVETSGEYNIPARDFYALGHLLASMYCQSLAIRYSKTTDSGIAADSVGHTSRAGEFSARARELEKVYLNHMELDKDQDLRPAGEFINWDTDTGDGRRRYMFWGGR